MRKLILLLLCATTLFAQASPTYFYVVTAVDANGMESKFSNERSAIFGQGQATATFSWTAPTTGSAAVGYNLYRSKVSGSGYVKVNTALITGVTASDTFLVPGAPTLAAPTVN